MTFEWTGWENDPAAGDSPYVDWMMELWGSDEKDGLSLAPLPLSPLAAKISGRKKQRAPLPPFARPGKVADDPLIRLTWMPDADCAIVGVIDSAIALSHARFRRLDGGSRFLCAWLQGGKWRDDAAVPFGRELFRTEIDQLMFRSMAAAALDENEFDRQAGSTQFFAARGDRTLETNATHGTFVSDLAAGYDLADSHEDEHRRRLPIIAVGLPPKTSMGSSGNFLEFFALHAIEYIIDRADRIWRACDLPKGGSFPLVINLSYGLQAGPKDGQMLIEQVIRAANAEAEKRDRPIRVILPAGNDLQAEGCAKFSLAAGGEEWIGWQLQPEDRTPNYAELWSGPVVKDDTAPLASPIGLSVAPPNGPASGPVPGRPDQRNTLCLDGKPMARIYCREHDAGEAGTRVGYVVCARPTLDDDYRSGAPSGFWNWTVSSEAGGDAFTYCQSDQSLTFGSETGYVSNFVHPDYRRYDDQGFLIDVASYTKPPVITDNTPPIRRRGTLNAIASLEEARVIGGYRVSDGKPAIYSSAAADDAVGAGREKPTCLMPSEDGPAHFGLMAAGSKSNSTALMSGTSFSTGLATRAVSQAMLVWISNGKQGEAPGTEAWFKARVDEDEAAKAWPGDTVPEKAGYGRMDRPDTGYPPRRWPS
jgi:hypothetical protein